MSLTNFKKSHLVGWIIIGCFFYLLITTLVFTFSAIALNQNQIIDKWPFNKYQQYYYFKATRKIWQYSECVEIHEQLIYVPKLGGCDFSNPEFHTTLTFDKKGRTLPNRTESSNPYKSGIAVLGDSFAMGWGVNDDQTFANVIQAYTDKPVYNLGVSSYGTDREIKRLIMSKLIDNVDTIIIQYCENDINENLAVNNQQLHEIERIKFEKIFNQKPSLNSYEKIKLILISVRAAAGEPFKLLKRLFIGSTNKGDFLKHQLAIEKVLDHYESELANKKILIFYVNGYQADYVSFPNSKSSLTNLDITYYDFQKNHLTKSDFYPIDGHLNANGHYNLGKAIVDFLNLNKTK